ncbi:heavy metal translocating P-type ATPase metal-binding domain-containing protein [Ravibacter arvi]|uniref:Heavy metal translocating P-type ATPase metal-binding domain-containing protein n=1 Tax=Ravibacter arvi TaxID=2051041 RepID=A0ABP8LZI1_9BACT
MEKEALQTDFVSQANEHSCFHCGLPCDSEPILFDEKEFCCSGCQAVYSILKERDLCTYYQLPDARGNSPDRSFYAGKYAYLDLPEIREKVVSFCEGGVTQVRWFVPGMHCSSCVWLLENLHRLHPGVMAALVDFPEKTVRISVRDAEIRLSELAGLMGSVGYEPYISLDDLAGKKKSKFDRTRIYKIGVAGFAFGNIMFMGISDYFTINGSTGLGAGMQMVFGVLSILLALPVFFYCSSDFFVSAWKAIKSRQLNIDAPIALAILVTFLRSLAEILTGTGSGYLDSMTGIVFFMLIGRYFQDKSYSLLSFDRDYKSFFPIAVSLLRNGKEEKLPISEIQPGDRLLIHSNEMIPCDGRLVSEIVAIDYSFVTGESVPVAKSRNDNVYAGGKVLGAAVEIEATRQVAQSYLTTLWNNDVFTRSRDEEENRLTSFINRYFTILVFLIGSAGWVYWALAGDFKRGFDAMTTVWIIACPCALLLSATFTNGNILRLLRKNGFYVKNAHVLERLAKVKAVVFDKTGTLTLPEAANVQFRGASLSSEEKLLAAHLAGQSVHPLSRLVSLALEKEIQQRPVALVTSRFREKAGAGLEATYGGVCVQLGSAKWVGAAPEEVRAVTSRVYLAFDGRVKGYFEIRSEYREGLGEAVKSLSKKHFETYLLSGDQPTDVPLLTGFFGTKERLNFSQTPQTKLRFIAGLQERFRDGVMMLGDGLNDAGALRQSDVGVAVSDHLNNFTPASDAILEGRRLREIGAFVRLARAGQLIVLGSFAISVIYNVIGLHFAVRGDLKPVVAAILMPASSISIILFTTLISSWKARQIFRKERTAPATTG